MQFINHSTRNEFANNVMVGVRINGAQMTANPSAVLMEVDDTVGANVYRGNFYGAGKIEGRAANAQEMVRPDFLSGWFAKFPAGINRNPADFMPAPGAPFQGLGALSPLAPTDRNGARRAGQRPLLGRSRAVAYPALQSRT